MQRLRQQGRQRDPDKQFGGDCSVAGWRAAPGGEGRWVKTKGWGEPRSVLQGALSWRPTPSSLLAERGCHWSSAGAVSWGVCGWWRQGVFSTTFCAFFVAAAWVPCVRLIFHLRSLHDDLSGFQNRSLQGLIVCVASGVVSIYKYFNRIFISS